MIGRRSLIDRFFLSINMFEFGECWAWERARNSNGYGILSVGGKAVLASHVAYELFIGPIPEGLFVLHTCNNGHKGCVNPTHLYVGTQQDNVDDRERKREINFHVDKILRALDFLPKNTKL